MPTLSEIDDEDYEVVLGLIFRYDPKRGSELQHIFERAGFVLARLSQEVEETKAAPAKQLGYMTTEGPIECALRKNLSVMSSPVYRVYAGARAELRRRGMKPDDDDIMSEAIEAAAALGL